MEALHALIKKNVIEKVQNQTSLAFLASEIQQQIETYHRSELTEQISEIREIQNGDTRAYKDLLAER